MLAWALNKGAPYAKTLSDNKLIESTGRALPTVHEAEVWVLRHFHNRNRFETGRSASGEDVSPGGLRRHRYLTPPPPRRGSGLTHRIIAGRLACGRRTVDRFPD